MGMPVAVNLAGPPAILVLSLQNLRGGAGELDKWFSRKYKRVLERLEETGARFIETSLESVTLSHLAEGNVSSVLITDGALQSRHPGAGEFPRSWRFKKVTEKLVEYAKRGGTVVFLGGLAWGCLALPDEKKNQEIYSYFIREWVGLYWYPRGYRKEKFYLNKSFVASRGGLLFTGLAGCHEMMAIEVEVLTVRETDCVYVRGPGCEAQPTASPVVFRKHGNGHVAWVGDMHIEYEVFQVIKAMCRIR